MPDAEVLVMVSMRFPKLDSKALGAHLAPVVEAAIAAGGLTTNISVEWRATGLASRASTQTSQRPASRAASSETVSTTRYSMRGAAALPRQRTIGVRQESEKLPIEMDRLRLRRQRCRDEGAKALGLFDEPSCSDRGVHEVSHCFEIAVRLVLKIARF